MDEKKPRTGGNRGGAIDHQNTTRAFNPTRTGRASAGAVDLDAARAALACIPPDLSRDDWVRVLAASKSAGISEAEARAWSAGGATYDARAFSDTWHSLNTDGGIGPGTLFFIAKEHGYRPDPSTPRPPPPTATELAQRQADRKPKPTIPPDPDFLPAAVWARSRPAADHSYCTARNGFMAGLRVVPVGDPLRIQRQKLDGWLVAPVWRQGFDDGAPASLVFIAPAEDHARLKAADIKTKLNLPGAPVDGFFVVGEYVPGAVVYVVEGIASAWAAHRATSRAAAVAFGWGNVRKVMQKLRERDADARPVIVADTGKEEKAATLAREFGVRCVCLPGDWPPNSDIDDYARAHGDDMARALLEGATAEPPADLATSTDTPTPADTPPLADPSAAAPLPDLLDTFPYGDGAFVLSSDGVSYSPPDDAKGNSPPDRWICGRLDVLAITRNTEGMEWGRRVEWRDPDGAPHRLVIPAELLAGDGAEVRRELASGGLAISTSRTARELLGAYVLAYPQKARAWCVNTTGWHRGVYVAPARVYGTPADGVPVVLQAAGTPSTAPSVAGTLADWQQHVAAPAAGNTRLVLVISAAFAGALLDVLGLEGGGLHLRGASSTGKSTALVAGASIFGDPAVVVRSWDTSPAGFEAIAAQHNDSALFADESGQSDPRNFGKTAYKITNGISATRATGNGGARQIKTWRLVLLSTGEISMAAHMATAGLRPAAGQELRIADIEADAGAGHGIFEHLHNHPHARALADALRDAVTRYHGTAGPAWLAWLAEHRQAITADARASFDQFVAAALTNTDATTAQAGRMARRFGAVAAAGELATRAGITGWAPGEATHAAHVCFQAWLDGFGRVPAEERALLDGVREFLERFGSSRFRDFSHAGHVVANLAGYYRTDADERVYLFTRTGLEEACRGADFKRAVALLVARGWIKPSPDGKPSQSLRPAGLPRTTRLYEMTDTWGAHE